MSWRKGPVDDFPNRRETPWPLGFATSKGVDGSGSAGAAEVLPDPPGLMGVRRPETELQALMETAPGDVPQESVEAQQGLRDELADVLEAMAADEEADGPRLLHVFQAHVNRGMSFGEIAEELAVSKTHAHHLFGLAQAYLGAALANAPLTQARLA